MSKGVGLTPTAGESPVTPMRLHAVAQAPHTPPSKQSPEHTARLPASTPSPGLQAFNSCSELTDSHVTRLPDKPPTQALNS